ncbi:TolB family protein [Nocardia sp. KC 131]|uniref:TolB family protein n=1 Tax=Nocardia arseniciresistens TaxID=3392119 RepID=UPI00398F54D8
MFETKGRVLLAAAVTVVLSGLIVSCDSDPDQSSPERSPRPAKIAFTDDWQSIFVMNPDGTGVTRIGDGSDPSFAPDGSRIVVGGRSISTMDPDGGNLAKLTDGGYNPRFSPDGTRIVFARGGIIFVMNADGGELKQLTATPDNFGGAAPAAASSQNPAFSPDGTKITFTRSAAIWVMESDGTAARQLLADPYFNSEPVFTPDGAGIVFTSNRGGKNRSEIYAMDVHGDHVRPLTDDSTGDPSFSSDGTQILFTRSTRDPASEAGPEVWVMNSDGGNPHRLTDPKQTAQHPSWGMGTGS